MLYQNCHINIDDSDLELVTKALKGNRISGKSKMVTDYENDLKTYFQMPFAISCNNATLGIKMILMINNVSDGDEVLLPCTAPIMCVLPILGLGARPIFVDTTAINFNIDLDDLKRKISSRSKVFINVPMWGYANNIDQITSLCHDENIKVLEDNSHCHGTKLNDKYLGQFADYSVFSTHERKMITTGEGGFLLVKAEEDYEKLTQLRSFGEIPPTKSSSPYGHFFGLNYKLSAVNAALGISQLKKLDDKIITRRKIGAKLSKMVESLSSDIKELQSIPNSQSNYYSIVFVTKPEIKIKLEKFLYEHHVISDPLRYGYCPLYEMPIVNEKIQTCPNSEKLIDSVFTLPTHEGLTDSDIDGLFNLLKTFFND